MEVWGRTAGVGGVGRSLAKLQDSSGRAKTFLGDLQTSLDGGGWACATLPRRGPSPLFVWFAGSAKTLRGKGGALSRGKSTPRVPQVSYPKFSPYPNGWPEVGTFTPPKHKRPRARTHTHTPQDMLPVPHKEQGLTCVGRSSARSSNPSPSLATIALPMSAPSARGATLWISVRGDRLGSRGRRQGGERGRPAGPYIPGQPQ